jgi:hypothetical protein
MVKIGGLVIVEWLVYLFNLSMNMGKVLEDWRSVIIIPLFKGKGDEKECKNYRVISLLSMPGRDMEEC